jgi:hypothetical protein
VSQQLPEQLFIKDSRVNAAISWILTMGLLIVTGVSLASFLLVDVIFAGVAAFVAIVPALVYRSWTTTVPWPILLLVSLPITFGVIQPTFFEDIITGLSISALAMLVVVALQLISSVRMTPVFAVVFTLIATLATAGFWAVGSAFSAAYFGTTFVETNTQLMLIFSATFLAGLVAAGIFRWYFRRTLEQNVDQSGERVVS